MSAEEAKRLTNPSADIENVDTENVDAGGKGEEKLLVLKAGKDAGFVEYAYLAPKHLKKQFAEITADTIDKQCEYFLKSFVKEFEGKIDEILELAEEFKAYLPDVKLLRVPLHFLSHVDKTSVWRESLCAGCSA
eukprot:m.447731 g.447731  ORF g.447731 m.447731 type:complete len:134 (+) comp21503_c0_seq1:164-565(+)